MIGESLEEGLRAETYAVDWVTDGHSADLALVHDHYDLVLLDLGLPKRSGVDLLQSYRKRGGDAPVLIITARDGLKDRVSGLDAGADDYLIKPFDLDELLARMRALVRRRVGRTSALIRFRGLELDPARHTVKLDGKVLELTARQFALLHALLSPPGRVVTRAKLEEKLYGWGEEVESNTVDVFIHHLRRKLGLDFIKNVRGVGYRVAELDE
jgi:two-component system OmpR family response regulator/two-component system response regulator QseB